MNSLGLALWTRVFYRYTYYKYFIEIKYLPYPLHLEQTIYTVIGPYL